HHKGQPEGAERAGAARAVTIGAAPGGAVGSPLAGAQNALASSPPTTPVSWADLAWPDRARRQRAGMKFPAPCLLALLAPLAALAQPAGADPYLWLEDVTGERALTWAREQNAIAQRELETSPEFAAIHPRILEILDSKARIPGVSKHGEFFYNFWRDGQHVRGIWRRTTLAEYRKAEPKWETVL